MDVDKLFDTAVYYYHLGHKSLVSLIREVDVLQICSDIMIFYRRNKSGVQGVCVAILILLVTWLLVKGVLLNIARKARQSLEVTIATKIERITNQFDDALQVRGRKATWELVKGNVGVYAIQGRRAGMEDRFTFVSQLEHLSTSIYGVFDGHGGEFAAEYCEKALFKKIMTKLLDGTVPLPSSSNEERLTRRDKIIEMLKSSFFEVDKSLLEVLKSLYDTSGTTAVITVLDDGILYAANCGDSRAVMCDSHLDVIPLSYDHKPDSPDERQRIEKAGGFVSYFGVWRVNGILATSRALGDSGLKKNHVVTPEPDIRTFDISQYKPLFMILASDGLWDVFTNEEAIRFVHNHLDESDFGAKSLVSEAYTRGSLDNISAIVVNFTLKTVSVPKSELN